MRDFAILCRVQVLGLLNSLAPGSRRKARGGRAARIGAAVLGYILLAGICAVYLFLMGYGLASVGLAAAIPVFAVLAGALGGVGFAFAKTRGTLFGLTDFDHVMALPVPRRTVVASRLASLYLAAIVTSALLAAPLYVAYFMVVGASVPSALCAAVAIVLAPAIPVSIAVFASFGLTALAARFRHANAAYIVLTLAFITALVIGIYGVSFSLPGKGDPAAMQIMTDFASAASQGVGAMWPPAAWAAAAVSDGSLGALAAFVAVSLIVPALTLEIIQRNYLTLNGLLVARSHASEGRRSSKEALGATGRAHARSPFQTLVMKEFSTMVGVPAYAINCLFGYVFLIVIAIALSIVGLKDILLSGSVDGVDLSSQDVAAAFDHIMILVPWAFAFFATMSPTAACSVSMEGRGAWIMATLPVSPRTILGSKLAANALPIAATLILCSGILVVSGQIPPIAAAEIVVLGYGIFHLIACVALCLDARRPNLSWSSPNEVVKRGLPVMVSVFGGMALGLGGGVGMMLLSTAIGITAAHAATLVVGVVAGILGQLVFQHACRTTTFQL